MAGFPGDFGAKDSAPGRGMLDVSMDDQGIVHLTHALTQTKFEFDRNDLDEVIGMLSVLRASIEAGEAGGESQ